MLAQRFTGWRVAWPYLTPAFVAIGVVFVAPLAYAVWLSVHDVQANIGQVGAFVGLDNFRKAFTSPDFYAATGRTLYFLVASLVLQVPLGILVALLLNQEFVGRNVLRALILIPWAVPTIVNGALWQWIYQSNFGALNGLLLELGLIKGPVLWLGAPQLALDMVIVADTWKVLPFCAITFLAGLQTIPQNLYEAAEVDGAGIWSRFTNVTLPQLMPVVLIIFVLRTVESFRAFDIIYQLTQGGPAGGTTVLAYEAYLTSFLTLQFGYGSAISLIIAAAALSLAAVYFRLLQSPE
jgi:multiple sugar transport system permease protein/N,N'-diacetylchitobiose transport system permease protein